MERDRLSLSKDEAAALLVLAARCIELDSGRALFRGGPIPEPPATVVRFALPVIERCRAWVTAGVLRGG